jgi:CheY-like chemotaxis protein
MNMVTMPHKAEFPDQTRIHTVLVVEDEMMVRLPIAEFLRDCGYNVIEAADAEEAIQAADHNHDVSVVFSDVRMPGRMDGFDLASWFRSHRPEVPVLLTSGYTAGRAEAVPAVKVIEKPYSQAHVARRIAALLED